MRRKTWGLRIAGLFTAGLMLLSALFFGILPRMIQGTRAAGEDPYKMFGAFAGPDVDDDWPTTRQVTTWEEFRLAWNDNVNVRKIILLNDIVRGSGSQTVSSRTASLEIDGRDRNGGENKIFNTGQTYLPMSRTPTPESGEPYALMHLHNLYAQNGQRNGIVGPGYWDGHGGTAREMGRWVFRFGNLYYVNQNANTHVVHADQAMLKFYGINRITITDEVAHPGSVYFEPNSEFYAIINSVNAIFWFDNSTASTDSGYGHTIELGEGAIVNVSNRSNTNARCIFWDEGTSRLTQIRVGKNAMLYSSFNSQGFATRAANQSLVAEEGSTVVFVGRDANQGPIIDLSNNNCFIEMKKGSSLFVIGGRNTTSGIVRITGSGSYIKLEDPKHFDIRNKNAGTASNGAALYMNAGTSFSVTNSDIDLWNLHNVADNALPNQSYQRVTSFSASGNNGASVSSSNSDLQSKFGNVTNYSRISGANTVPIVTFPEPMTDALKHVGARVALGMIPNITAIDNNADGKISYTVQYADATRHALAAFAIDDGSFPDVAGLLTNANAWAYHPETYQADMLPDFLQAGSVITASANRGGWQGEYFSSFVHDVTPPVPAVINDDIFEEQTVIEGINGVQGNAVTLRVYADASATVPLAELTVDADGAAVKVGADGTWRFKLPAALQAEQVVQVFYAETAVNKANVPMEKYEELTGGSICGAQGTPGETLFLVIYQYDGNGKVILDPGGHPIPVEITKDADGDTVTVHADGTWNFKVPQYALDAYENGQATQIFMTETRENKNPVNNTPFGNDGAVFPAATRLTVQPHFFRLHIRQVVWNPGNIPMRSWPSEGYTSITAQRGGGSYAPKVYNIVTASGFDPLTAQYTAVELPKILLNNTVQIQNIIPQYFTYAGYALSATEPVSSGVPTAGNISIAVNADREYWVTVYISPVNYATSYYSSGVADHYFGPVTG